MTLALWLLAVAALSTFCVETAFVYSMTVKRLLRTVDVPLEMKLVAYFWLAVGLPADFLFNVTRGTVIFREFPRELLFSHRVQRHMRSSGWRLGRAIYWATILNAIDENHIKV